jgi:drug/metabolite transporter (DMT)-like permease
VSQLDAEKSITFHDRYEWYLDLCLSVALTIVRSVKLVSAFAVVYVVWGSTYLAMAVADRSLPPLLMLAVRFSLAGAILWCWAWRRGELRVRPTRREWGAAAVIGFALLVLDTGGVAWAVQRVPTGTAALLAASVPLFMALFDRVCFGVRLPLGALAGIATGLVGVGLLAGPSGHVDLLGVAVLLGASFTWAAGSAYMRVAPSPSGAFAGAAMQMLTAGLALGVIGAATGELGDVHVRQISPSAIGAVGFLVVFGSLLAFTAYGWLVQHAPTQLLSTDAYVNPVVAVVLGWLFAGEHVGGREIAAGLVILASVAMLLLARRPAAEQTAPEPMPAAVGPRAASRTADVSELPRLAELDRLAA